MRAPRVLLLGLLALLTMVLALGGARLLQRAPSTSGDASSSAPSAPLATWTVPLQDGTRLPPVPSVPDAGLPGTTFVAQAGDAAGLVRALETLLPRERRIVLQTQLRRFCTQAFGNAVSCSEEILPAVRGPLTVTVADGTPSRWMLHGESADTDAFRALLPLLHASARERITAITRVTRQLSPAHVFDNLRVDPSAVLESTEERRGWTVHATTDREGRGLVSAVRGGRFILGAERSSLLAALDPLPAPLPSSLSRVVAQGMLSRDILSGGLLSALLPPSALASFPTGGSGTLLWQAEQRGNQLTITVR